MARFGARISLAEQGHPADDRPACVDPDGYLVEIEQPA
jgi:hypothetical protein